MIESPNYSVPTGTASSSSASAGLVAASEGIAHGKKAAWAAAAAASSACAANAVPQDLLAGHRPAKLKYAIHSYSSAAPTFPPHQILYNRPGDQASRWTTLVSDQAQFLTIVLDRPAVVTHLVFGKYHKEHVCNLKEFRVLAGMHMDEPAAAADPATAAAAGAAANSAISAPGTGLVEVFHGGLENSPEMETVALRHRTPTGAAFPVRFLKIVPLASFQREFPYSIWYLEAHGIADPLVVDRARASLEATRENELVRACLKFFRQRNFSRAFAALAAEVAQHPGAALEDPLLSQLHACVVHQRDYEAAERLIVSAAEQGMLDEHVSQAAWTPKWAPVAVPQHMPRPCGRGGHQAFLDADANVLYVHGGWDGARDLGDLWAFDLSARTWTCVAHDTRAVGHGPSPRSCHKICVDPARRCAYMLGRFIDTSDAGAAATAAMGSDAIGEGGAGAFDSDFWRFDLDSRTWTRLSTNTANDQGPSLIYDHQMAMDSDAQILYVFGGRVVTRDASVQIFSGLYAYHVREARWVLLRHDSAAQELKPRVSHAMVFHPPTRQLLVLGGQRSPREPFAHFLAYDVTKDHVAKLASSGAPDMSLTQRAAYDAASDSVLVFSNLVPRPRSASVAGGLAAAVSSAVSTVTSPISPATPASTTSSIDAITGVLRTRPTSAPAAPTANASTLWVYRMHDGTWHSVPLPSTAATGGAAPRPRYAHQVIYDARGQRVLLFGGNPDDPAPRNLRLDDFWELHLHRPAVGDVVREAAFLLRRQRFLDLCRSSADPIEAMHYLQAQVAATVAPDQVHELAALSMHLFAGGAAGAGQEGDDDDGFAARSAVYDRLASFFPKGMKQPEGSLVDYLPFA
ncbi:hypothetical protein H9P43_005656 [Blastocladiella emersonii ATCC 22665]|nr:hypothetical protein H9P43_005656 [Blastocladiella emersonii ATCC 22665]